MKGLISHVVSGYFGQFKIIQKNWKMSETLSFGNSSESTQRELSNEYQHEIV